MTLFRGLLKRLFWVNWLSGANQFFKSTVFVVVVNFFFSFNMIKQYEESVSSSIFATSGSKFSENNLRKIRERSNQIRWSVTVRVWRNPCEVMTFCRFRWRLISDFSCEIFTEHLIIRPTRGGMRCLKGCLPSETLTHKNSGQNDYISAKTSGSINYVTKPVSANVNTKILKY